ncbi:hypothetical protein [Streptomyces harbinensis]|uniref:hypothetical protein n=1 Tax=Streptomyces harbinensis TaxID=1176198 RepID=UPI00367BC0F0
MSEGEIRRARWKAAVPLWRRRPAGVVVAGLVMGADLAAKGWVHGPDSAAL